MIFDIDQKLPESNNGYLHSNLTSKKNDKLL